MRLAVLAGLLAAVVAACGGTSTALSGATPSATPPDPANAKLTIDGRAITLVNGRAERDTSPASAGKAVTTLSDKTVAGDLDGDGRPDLAVVVVDQPGGSGSFSYVAVLLNRADGVTVTPAVLLGDRVRVNGLRLDGGTLIVDVLDHAPGQPLSSAPDVAVTKRFAVSAGALIAK